MTPTGSGPPSAPIVDLPDERLRDALVLKWGAAQPGWLAAWVAEMDYALDPVVEGALTDAVLRGITGYPALGSDKAVGPALAGFARRQWGWAMDPANVVLCGDVMSGVSLALDVLSEPGPVVVPTPAYPPFLDVAELTGRKRVDVPLDPDSTRAALDLDAIDAALAEGARTVLLCQPHNPWGRVFDRSELEGLRDVVVRHGARVISDEIHAPLALDGTPHVPYLTLDGTADHAVTVTASSKAWNTPGLKCAQIVTGDGATAQTLRAVPLVANHGLSPLGVIAAVASYTHGEPWLASLRERLAQQRDLFAELVAEHLPLARIRPLEGTYLAWVDVRAYGHDKPARVAQQRGRVWVSGGDDFGAGGAGHVRVNIATSPERLREIVVRLASAWA